MIYGGINNLGVIKTALFMKNKLNYQAVYLPFIYKHEGNKLRKVFISEYD